MTRTARLLAFVIVALAGLPAAASADTVITSGTLTDASGAAAAGQVRVHAWPLSKQAMELPLVGTAQAGPDGRFTVTAADGELLRRLAARDGGWLDFTAVGDMPGYTARWTFTAFVDTAGGQARVSTPDAVSSSAGHARVATAASSAPRIRLRARRALPFAVASQLPGEGCDTKMRQKKPRSIRKLAVIGELNNAYNDGTVGTFSYARERSADTRFGVAAFYGGAGPYIDGERHVHDAGTATFPKAKRRYSRKLRSLFEFTQYEIQASSCAVWEKIIKATSWIGGTDSRLKQDGLDKCDPKQVQPWEGGAAFHRENNDAVRFTRAVEAFGVNLTSQSGFSKDVTLDYEFGGSGRKSHFLCGPDGKQSPYEAGRVFSGTRK